MNIDQLNSKIERFQEEQVRLEMENNNETDSRVLKKEALTTL